LKFSNWILAFLLLILELFVGYEVFYWYPLISMLIFGEQSNSFLYSKQNALLWAMSPLILPVFNLVIMLAEKSTSEKIKTTNRLVFYSYLFCYIVFIIVKLYTRGGFTI